MSISSFTGSPGDTDFWIQGQSAAGENRLARYVRRLIGSQESEQRRDLGRGSGAAHGNVALHLSARFRIIDPGAVDGSHNRARPHRIHPYASIRVFQSQRLRQVPHAALADGVAEVFRLGDDFMDARVVDDNPAAAVSGQEMANGFPGAEERPSQIDPDDAVEIGGFDLVTVTLLRDFRAVDPCTARAKPLPP